MGTFKKSAAMPAARRLQQSARTMPRTRQRSASTMSRSPIRTRAVKRGCCARSTSRSRRATSSRSWGRRAPASRRCCRSSACSTGSSEGEYWFDGEPVHELKPRSAPGAAQEAHRLRLPAVPPARRPHGRREPRHAAVVPRRAAQGAPRARSPRRSTASRSSARRTSTRTSSPAASSSWWRWRAR